MNETLFYDLKGSSGLAPSLSAQISRELGRRVVAGKYAPGDLIEDEGSLAENYQVSRSVIRDAIKVLVGKGLLEARRGIGTRVRPRYNWSLMDSDVLAWHLSASVSEDFLRQLMDLRFVIEPKASYWAAKRGSAGGLEQINQAQKRMEQEKGSLEDFIVADASFHQSILRVANNDLLQALEGVIFSALISSISLTNTDPRENEDSLPFHRAVTDAILMRDADSAESHMEKLLGDTQERLGRVFMDRA